MDTAALAAAAAARSNSSALPSDSLFLSDAQAATLASDLHTSFSTLFQAASFLNISAQQLRLTLWQSIGYIPPPPPTPLLSSPALPLSAAGIVNSTDSSSGGSSEELAQSVLAAAIAVPVAIVAIIAAAIAFMCMPRNDLRWSQAGKDVFGRVVPPRVGPLATIVVARLPANEELRLTLPGAVFEEVLRLYEECVKDSALRHSGYESTMPGARQGARWLVQGEVQWEV